MADIGLLGLTLPECYGGSGIGLFGAVGVIEEIAKISPADTVANI